MVLVHASLACKLAHLDGISAYIWQELLHELFASVEVGGCWRTRQLVVVGCVGRRVRVVHRAPTFAQCTCYHTHGVTRNLQ